MGSDFEVAGILLTDKDGNEIGKLSSRAVDHRFAGMVFLVLISTVHCSPALFLSDFESLKNSPKGIRTPVAGLKTRCPGPA